VELRLRVRALGKDVGKIVRVRLDMVDLTEHTRLVAIPAKLRTCAETVHSLAVRSTKLKALPAWLGELTTLRMLELRVCSRVKTLPQGLSALTGLEDLLLMDCSGLKEVPAWVTALTGLRVPFQEWRLEVRNEGGTRRKC
jgi:hypothetical protein